jgi:hypothetical protein
VSDELWPYAGIGIALALAATLWFMSPRPYTARSFAIGVLLAAAMLYADDGSGWIF